MKFVIYTDAEGKTRWKLVAKNGKIVADSAERYHSEGNARRAIKSWRELARSAPVTVQKAEQ